MINDILIRNTILYQEYKTKRVIMKANNLTTWISSCTIYLCLRTDGIVLRVNIPINISITLDRMRNKHGFCCERELHNQAHNLVGRENA